MHFLLGGDDGLGEILDFVYASLISNSLDGWVVDMISIDPEFAWVSYLMESD